MIGRGCDSAVADGRVRVVQPRFVRTRSLNELLEVDERPARALVEMAMQDRQGEHAILGVAEKRRMRGEADFAGPAG